MNYKVVRDLVPSLWDTYQGHKIDIAIHIGMASPRPFYQIERRAHRRGYTSLDVDNELLEDGANGKPHNEDWIWYDLPDEILSDLDIDDVHKRWQGHSSVKTPAAFFIYIPPDFANSGFPKQKDMDLRISEDPGRYLCDFIYYSSLAHLYKANRPRKVVFLHVPSDASDGYVSQGRELAVNLIRSLVESETVQKKDQPDGHETSA